MNDVKVYVGVKAEFDENGTLLPLEIQWENGHRYSIDKVTNIRQAAATRAGGQGDRYTIRVNGRQSYLFFERSANQTGNNIGRWFVERRVPKPHIIGSARLKDNSHSDIYSDR